MKTVHDGANAERKCFRAHLKRMRAQAPVRTLWIFDELIVWIDKRTERYKKRKGGL